MALVLNEEQTMLRDAARDFLAGRALGFWLIGFSLIASNISTEQLVGQAGQGADFGLAVAAYIAGGALGLSRLYSSDLQRSLEASPVFSTLSNGALFLRYIVPPPESLIPEDLPSIPPELSGPPAGEEA